MTIRRAVPGDLESLRDICLRTGDGGADATGRWSDDGLLPDVFLEPYLRYPEGLAWVIDEGSGAAGYLVAVADTRDFVQWWRQDWVGIFVDRHGRATEREGEGWLYDGGAKPENMLAATPLDEFPAHLHIDLLPVAQGRGHGRALMRSLGQDLVERAVRGVHLRVGAANAGAIEFYRRLGFDETVELGTLLMTAPSERLAAL